MPPETPPLPPKPEVALALLQTATSVYVHLDPRAEEVVVPPWFKNQPQLVLQIGLNMAVPIPDLDVGREAVSCTLSFNRRPEFCRIPWESIYGLVGEDGRGMIWPESIPPEVAAAADGRSGAPKSPRPHLRVAAAEGQKITPGKSGSLDTGPTGRGSAKGVEESAPDTARLQQRASDTLNRPAGPGDRMGGSAKRRELPPYLRVVK